MMAMVTCLAMQALVCGSTEVCEARDAVCGISDKRLSQDQALLQSAATKKLIAKRHSDRDSGRNTELGRNLGYPSTGVKKAANLWCAVDVPPPQWNLKSCPASGTTSVKVLTYNLFWWNLFNIHHGSGRSAGRLIARTGGPEKYDIMGFQECDDVWRVLHDAEMHHNEYDAVDGGRAIAVAWRKTKWTKLAHDSVDVGEDSKDQYYGKRSAMWVRLRNNQDGKTVFFVNHHGPLKVSQTGGCTGTATALNIMKLISENAQTTDLIILVGDFNAALGSSRINELERRLDKVHSGRIFGGVDHIFSNCGSRGHGQTLGKGEGHYKSDHEALSATFRI